MLPQIVQQGAGTASADSAKAAVTATIRPVKAGRKVALQEQLKGTSWKKVANAKHGPSRSRRVRRADLQERHCRSTTASPPGVQGPQGGHQRARQHRALADPDVLRRVLRLGPLSPCGACAARLRADQQARLLQGRPEGRQGHRRHPAPQRDQGPGPRQRASAWRSSARRSARPSPTASTATSAPGATFSLSTALPPPASRCRSCRASTGASGCSRLQGENHSPAATARDRRHRVLR